MKKTIKLMLPVTARVMHELEMDVEGKTEEEIFNEFLDESDLVSGSLCYHCSNTCEVNHDNIEFNEIDFKDYEEDLKKQIE